MSLGVAQEHAYIQEKWLTEFCNLQWLLHLAALFILFWIDAFIAVRSQSISEFRSVS